MNTASPHVDREQTLFFSSFLVWKKGAIIKWRNTKDWKGTEQTHTTIQYLTNNSFLNTKKHPFS